MLDGKHERSGAPGRRVLAFDVDLDVVRSRMIALCMTPRSVADASGLKMQRVHQFFRGDFQTLATCKDIATALGLEPDTFVRPRLTSRRRGQKKK
jgi:transcriptional regulator with XRE-family HTH domain